MWTLHCSRWKAGYDTSNPEHPNYSSARATERITGAEPETSADTLISKSSTNAQSVVRRSHMAKNLMRLANAMENQSPTVQAQANIYLTAMGVLALATVHEYCSFR